MNKLEYEKYFNLEPVNLFTIIIIPKWQNVKCYFNCIFYIENIILITSIT